MNRIIWAIILCISLNGCASAVATWVSNGPVLYGGTRIHVEYYKEATEDFGGPIQLLMSALDLPMCFAIDTVLAPFAIMRLIIDPDFRKTWGY